MKKILIALLAITISGMANAATCSWKMNGIVADSLGNDVTTYKAFLMNAGIGDATTLLASISAIEGNLLKGITTDIGNALGDASLTKSFGKGVINGSTEGFTVGDYHNLYIVVLNNSDISKATEFMISAYASGEVKTTGGLALTFGNADTNGYKWQSMGNIPEPTSGLLLLVGGALLALRRKQK